MKLKHLLRIVGWVLLGYSILFIISSLFFDWLLKSRVNPIQIFSTADTLSFLPFFAVTFFLTFTTLIYLFNSWLEGKWVSINLPRVILFVGAMGGLGPIGEILVNSVARFFFHHPLWVYQLLPVHGGDTSMVMSVIWPLYGFHIYCFHNALKAKRDKTTDFDLAFFVGVDAITLEVLVNIFTIFFFYTYIFFYLAGDLQHLSTALIFIPYVISGYVIVKVVHLLEKTHQNIILGIIGLLVGWSLIFLF